LKKKSLKKIVLTGATLSALTLGTLSTFTVLSSETQVVHAAIPGWMKKAFFKVVSAVGSRIYNVNASVTYGKYGETITPGTINFNGYKGSKYGAEVAYNVNALSTNHSVAIYANTTPFNWGKKISVILRNPSGTRLINKSVTSGQWSGVAFSRKGNHEVSFVSNTKTNWTPYIAYRYDTGYKVYGRSSTPIVTEEIYEETSDYGKLVIPTWNEDNTESSSIKNKKLNIHELNNQMLDDNGMYIYGLRDFEADEKIQFEDTIQTITYDSNINETTFVFDKEDAESSSLKFSGDLRNNFSDGDVLSLNFNTEYLTEDSNTFIVPDYYKYLIDNNNEAPNLNNFLQENN